MVRTTIRASVSYTRPPPMDHVVIASRPMSPWNIAPEEESRPKNTATGGCGTLELHKGGNEPPAGTLEMAQSLLSGRGGVPVFLIDLSKMLVEEYIAWSDGQDSFSLGRKPKELVKPKPRSHSSRGKNMKTFKLSDIKAVTLLSSWSPEEGEPERSRDMVAYNSLRELWPKSHLMLCIRLDSGDAVNMVCQTTKMTRIMYTFLSQNATAIPALLRAFREPSGRTIISSGAKAMSYKQHNDGTRNGNSKKRRNPKATKRTTSKVYVRLVNLLRGSLSETRSSPPKQHFGPIYLNGQKTFDLSSTPLLLNDTSSSCCGRQKLKDKAEQQQKKVIDGNATKGPSLNKEVPSRVTLKASAQGGISDAVPLKPPCYVVREMESARLEDALSIDPAPGLTGGPTTVIFDPEANGKSVIAAAVVQDTNVHKWYPGGVIWLRVGRAANSRLLQMMELAIAQVTEAISRETARIAKSRAPKRFNNEGAASDYLASLLVRTCVGGARGVLLVLDDVWDVGIIMAFRKVGLSLLVTTRKPMITSLATEKLPGSRRLVGPLGPMSPEQAMAIATKAVAAPLYQQKDIKEVVDSTGRYPLAVGAVASILKQARGPLHWRKTATIIRQIFSGLQRWRGVPEINPGEAYEDRIIASFAVSLSTMPERYQVLFSALWVVPCGLPVTCNLLGKIWETSKRKTILVAEALEDRRLLERHAPGTFTLHYEAAKFLRQPPGFVGGAWVGSKLQGQARNRVLKLLHEYVGSLDTLSNHLKRRDLWGLAELWKAYEAEETTTSLRRIYKLQLDRRRLAAGFGPSPDNLEKPLKKKLVCEATCLLARGLEMVADFQELVGCCDPTHLYRESVEAFNKSLDFAVDHGSDGVNASDLDSLKISAERTALKLDTLLLKHGKTREAPDLSRESLVFAIADKVGGSDRRANVGGSTIQPQLDVAVGSLFGMVETLTKGKNVEEAQALFEELTIILRKLYSEEACLCLEARIKQELASMMATAGRLDEAKALNDQCLLDVNKAFGTVHPVMARVRDQRGLLLKYEKKLDAASACFQEALKIREAAFGAGDVLANFNPGKAAGTSREAMCQNKRHGSSKERVADTSTGSFSAVKDDQDPKIVSGFSSGCQSTSLTKPPLPPPPYEIVVGYDSKCAPPPPTSRKSPRQLVPHWERGYELVRQHFGATPAVFSSTDADVRLNVGHGCLKENQAVGPITVVTDQFYLVECDDAYFLVSVIVECQPSGSAFKVPLELDFRVGGPLDEYGDSDCDASTLDSELREEYMAMLRETYEVLERSEGKDAWALTQQETTTAVYDDGIFFVRASVNHFSQWCLGKTTNLESACEVEVVTWPRRPGRKEIEFVNATDRTLIFLVLPTTWSNQAVRSIATGLTVEKLGAHLAISKAVEQSILEEATHPQIFQVPCTKSKGPLQAGQKCPSASCRLADSTGYDARVALITMEGPSVAVWDYLTRSHRMRVITLPGQFSDGMVPLLGQHRCDDLAQGSVCLMGIALAALAKSLQRNDEPTPISTISSTGFDARLEAG